MPKNYFQYAWSLKKRPRIEYREWNDIVICKKYFKKYRPSLFSAQTCNIHNSNNNYNNNDALRITVLFARDNLSHKKCIFNYHVDRSLRRLSRNECIEIYKKSKNVLISYRTCVCCPQRKIFFLENFTDSRVKISLNAKEILKIIKNIVLNKINKLSKCQAILFFNYECNCSCLKLILINFMMYYNFYEMNSCMSALQNSFLVSICCFFIVITFLNN